VLNIGNNEFTLNSGYDDIQPFAYNTNVECEVGCTDADASNYNPNAILDDGSCVVFGCTITNACNYNPNATAFDGSCYYCYMDDCNMYPSNTYDCDGCIIGEDCNTTIEEENTFSWSIYPNPFKDYTTIELSDNKEINSIIEIINISGQVIYSQKVKERKHLIHNTFSPGYYIIQLKSDQILLRKTLIIE